MQKWEYHSTSVHGTDLQMKGQEGWELVGMNHETMVWKRSIEEPVPVTPPAPAKPAGA